MQPLITIVIPTYNRSRYLIELLNGIAQQVRSDHLEETVAVHVNDNCSSDGTREKVEAFIRTRPFLNITYARNEDNLGGDRNIDLAVRASKTAWTWLFGDDDRLTDGALAFVVERIRGLPPDISFVNTRTDTYDATLQKRIAGDASEKIGRDRIFRGIDEESARFYSTYCFIGSHIFKTERWAQTPDLDRYIGSCIPHFYFMLYWIGQGQKIAFFDRVCIHYRHNNSVQNEEGMFAIALGILRDRPGMVEKTITNVSSRRTLLKAFFYSLPFLILSFKKTERRGLLPSGRTLQLFNEARRHYGFIPGFWMIYAPQVFIPPPLTRLLKKAYDAWRMARNRQK